MSLNSPETPQKKSDVLRRSPLRRVFVWFLRLVLIAPLITSGCVHTQKPEPANASEPAPDPFSRDSVVGQKCKGLIRIFEKLHIEGKNIRQFMSQEDIESVVDCYNLLDAESELKHQKRGK